MPQPKLATFPAIRGALKFYQVASIITGVGLLLLVAEMILKYSPMHVELFVGGTGGAAWFAQVIVGDGCQPWSMIPFAPGHCKMTSTGDGINVSLAILVIHGWFYVVYLFACFRIWSLMRWGFPRFITLALGGIVPLLSFFMEARVAREVKAYLAHRESQELHSRAEHSSLTQEIPTENKR